MKLDRARDAIRSKRLLKAGMLLVLAIVLMLAAGTVLGRVLEPGADQVSATAQIKVNASVEVAPVGDIVGAVVNEHYWSATDPIHPDWNDKYLGRTVDQVRQLAPVNGKRFAVRFGHTPTDGSWGKDGYHWLQAFDPKNWATSIDEFMEYTHAVAGEPYVGVNFGSGTAEEAASFVAYANGTDPGDQYVEMRTRQAQAEPYGIAHWVLGFEQYGQWETGFLDSREFDYANPEARNGGDPKWFGKPASDPRFFAQRAAEFARAMRAASPTPIKLYVPGNNWDLAAWGGPEASMQALLGELGDLIDGVVVHFYPMGSAYGESDEALLGRTETLNDKLGQLRVLLSRYGPKGKELEIADVEFNNRGSSNAQTHQLVNGLFVADTLRVLASNGVTSAFYFAISVQGESESGFSYFENGDVTRPMPTYLASRLLARHLGADVVQSDVSRGIAVTASGGSAGPFSYPTLTSLASLSADRRTLYLVVVNKHLVYDQKATIDLQAVRVGGQAQVTVLNGPSPRSGAGEVGLVQSTRAIGTSFSHTFPAHSVTAMEIPLSAPAP